MIDYPGSERIRAVTHYGIETADVDRAVDATRRALRTVGLADTPPTPVGAAVRN